MAEIIGTVASVITLVGVFKSCIEGFDLIKGTLNHDMEVKKLVLKLKVERCRLLVWGQSVGLVPSSDGAEKTLLDDFPFSDTIQEILEYLVELFQKSNNLVDRYGCCKLSTSEFEQLHIKAPTPSEKLSAAFDRNMSRINKKATRAKDLVIWVVNDQKRFAMLIQDAKDLIDGLQDITKEVVSTSHQEHVFTDQINKLDDPETLYMIAEVCETDHPPFSDSASVRADAISGAATEPPDVLGWVQDTSDSMESDQVYKIDDWDKTELKQRYLDLMQANEKPMPSLSTIFREGRESAPWKAPDGYGYFCGYSGCAAFGWPMLGSFMDHMYDKHPECDFEADQYLQIKEPTVEMHKGARLSSKQQRGLDSNPSRSITSKWHRSPRILMVEDDPTCIRIVKRFLLGFDCTVEVAIDGIEAVNKADTRTHFGQTAPGIPGPACFDLILMDIIIPTLDGVSACILIKQFSNVKIIAMTSCVRPEDIQIYYQHGMEDCLAKPFTKVALLNMLEKHLPDLIIGGAKPMDDFVLYDSNTVSASEPFAFASTKEDAEMGVSESLPTP